MSKKKMIRPIIALALIFIMSFPAVAVDNADTASLESSTLDRIENYLACLISDSEGYGLSDIDPESLQCGSGINVYEYDNGIAERLNSTMYPIFSNGTLFTTIFVQDDTIQIATSIADELTSVGKTTGNIALIYDANCLRVWDDTELIVLHTYSTVQDRDVLSSLPDNIESLPLQACNDIDLSSVAIPYENFTTTLSIPIYLQASGSRYCWACACASIGNYKTGASITGVNFAKYWYSNNYSSKSLTIAEAIGKLNQYYSLSYVEDGVLSISTIKSYLQSGSPIYASCSVNGSSTNHHAIAIRGVDTTNGYISVMDPEVNYYVSASMAWDEGTLTYKYVSPTSLCTLVVKYCGHPT